MPSSDSAPERTRAAEVESAAQPDMSTSVIRCQINQKTVTLLAKLANKFTDMELFEIKKKPHKSKAKEGILKNMCGIKVVKSPLLAC